MPFSQDSFGSVNMFDSDNKVFSQMNDLWSLNNLLAFDDSDFHMDLGLVDSLVSMMDFDSNSLDSSNELNSDSFDLDFGDFDSNSLDQSNVSDDNSVDSDDSFVNNQSNLNSLSLLSDSDDLFMDNFSDLMQDNFSLMDDQSDLSSDNLWSLLEFFLQNSDFNVNVVLFDNMFDVFLNGLFKLDDLILGLLGFELNLFKIFGQYNLDFTWGNSDSLHGGYDRGVYWYN
jgi:hypothetical protein